MMPRAAAPLRLRNVRRSTNRAMTMSSVGGGSGSLVISKVSLGNVRPRPSQVKQREGQAPISAARIDSTRISSVSRAL
jgi:hypothetical protein